MNDDKEVDAVLRDLLISTVIATLATLVVAWRVWV